MLWKYAPFVLALSALLSFSACGSEDSDLSDGDGDSVESAELEESAEIDGDVDDEALPEGDIEAEAVDGDGEYDAEAIELESDGEQESAELPDPETVELRGECPQAERYGFFEIQNGIEFGSISGKVAAGVVPQAVQDEILSEGYCRLFKKRNLFCDPPCDSEHTCETGNQCIIFPRNQDAGTVTIEGLPLVVNMSALPPGNNYAFNDVDNPPIEAGKTIRLSSTDGYAGSMLMHGVGVDELEVPEEIWLMDRDSDLEISWDAPSGAVRSKVLAIMSVDQHGSSPVTLRCELDDTGSAQIPAAIINALLDSGISGYPNGRLVRRTADSMSIEAGGCVELLVTSPREVTVRVKGFVPCDKPEDCPEDQTCNMISHLCE